MSKVSFAKDYGLTRDPKDSSYYYKRCLVGFEEYGVDKAIEVEDWKLKVNILNWINKTIENQRDATEASVYFAETSLAAYNEYLKNKNQ